MNIVHFYFNILSFLIAVFCGFQCTYWPFCSLEGLPCAQTDYHPNYERMYNTSIQRQLFIPPFTYHFFLLMKATILLCSFYIHIYVLLMYVCFIRTYFFLTTLSRNNLDTINFLNLKYTIWRVLIIVYLHETITMYRTFLSISKNSLCPFAIHPPLHFSLQAATDLLLVTNA